MDDYYAQAAEDDERRERRLTALQARLASRPIASLTVAELPALAIILEPAAHGNAELEAALDQLEGVP